jgi:uncharacterized RDD family membrane protein YckC
MAGIIDGLVFLPLPIILGIFIDTSDKWMFLGGELFYNVCWMVYYVVGHGKYGQTLGKKMMGIKVFNLDERTVIGYKKAFLRESVWLLVTLTGIIILLIKTQNDPSNAEDNFNSYDNLVMIASSSWFLLELITMLSNTKRRAIHDYIAGSVVVDLKELEKEKTVTTLSN